MTWTVRHDREAKKLIADIEGQEATISYEPDADGTLDLVHTFVPPALRGKGVADELARQAIEQLKAEGTAYRLTCPFLRTYALRHPEAAPTPA